MSKKYTFFLAIILLFFSGLKSADFTSERLYQLRKKVEVFLTGEEIWHYLEDGFRMSEIETRSDDSGRRVKFYLKSSGVLGTCLGEKIVFFRGDRISKAEFDLLTRLLTPFKFWSKDESKCKRECYKHAVFINQISSTSIYYLHTEAADKVKRKFDL